MIKWRPRFDLIFSILFTILLFNPIFLSSTNEFYYTKYQYDLKSPNVTLGAISPSAIEGKNIISVGFVFAAICQAEQINQGLTNVNIQGNINILIQKLNGLMGSGQQASMSIFENNLFNASTNLPIYGNQTIPLLGIFGFAGAETSQINSLITEGFGVPFVSAGTRSDVDPDNKILLEFGPTNSTFYETRETVIYTSFQAAVDTLNYFNWTVVGTIFQDNAYGYRRQANVQLHQSLSATPDFVCTEIFTFFQLKDGVGNQRLADFCRCITDKSEISVIVLWMAISEAGITISSLKSQCPAAKKWTFLITYDNDFQVNNDFISDIFKNSLLLRQFNNWNFKGFASNCIETASPRTKMILQQLQTDIYAEAYNCELTNTNSGKVCQLPFFERFRNNETCTCTETEFNEDIYTVRNIYCYLLHFPLTK